MTDTPWEPPLAGTEAEHLVGALERLRATFRWKADGLDPDGLTTCIGASSLTLGGLLKHLAAVEDQVFVTKMSGEAIGPPWDTEGRDDPYEWPFTSAADDTPEELYALWDGRVARSRVGWRRPWTAVDWTSSSTSPGPTASTPACAGLCAT